MSSRALDLRPGTTFSRLTVIERCGYKGRNAAWLCRCSCGSELVVNVASLRNGNTKSCGCYKKQHVALLNRTRSGCNTPGEAEWRQQYASYRYGAKRRGHTFSISIEEFKDICRRPCRYCGCVGSLFIRTQSADSVGIRCNGIDRVYNDVGYELSNCVPCCTRCNFAKHAASQADFLAWVDSVARHQRLIEPRG